MTRPRPDSNPPLRPPRGIVAREDHLQGKLEKALEPRICKVCFRVERDHFYPRCIKCGTFFPK